MEDPTKAVAEFITLTEAKRKLDAEKRDVQKRLDELSPIIIDDFHAHGRQSESRNGFCVYLSRDISIKSKTGDTADVVDKLRRARLGELIGLNHPKVRAWCKERLYNKNTDSWEIDESKLPPSLREVIQIEDFFRLNCRKA